MKPPAPVYTPCQKAYEGLPELDYPFHDKSVIVTTYGRICFQTRKINLSQFFAGQRVGIKQVEDRLWLVSSGDYDLGYWNRSTTTRVKTVTHVFGIKFTHVSGRTSRSW